MVQRSRRRQRHRAAGLQRLGHGAASRSRWAEASYASIENLTADRRPGCSTSPATARTTILIGNASANALTGGRRQRHARRRPGQRQHDRRRRRRTYVTEAAADILNADASVIEGCGGIHLPSGRRHLEIHGRSLTAAQCASAANVENLILLGTRSQRLRQRRATTRMTGNAANNILRRRRGRRRNERRRRQRHLHRGQDWRHGRRTMSLAAGGIDLVQSSMSYALGDNLENLTRSWRGGQRHRQRH